MNLWPEVVDASVAVKWVLDEEHTSRAQALLTGTIRDGRQIVGPPHMTAEVSNIIYRRRLRSDPAFRITGEEADHAIERFLRIPLTLLTFDGLYTEAFAFARTYRLDTVYDSLYVVLAQRFGADLWTADLRLLTALAGRAPWVRFIGDYPR